MLSLLEVLPLSQVISQLRSPRYSRLLCPVVNPHRDLQCSLVGFPVHSPLEYPVLNPLQGPRLNPVEYPVHNLAASRLLCRLRSPVAGHRCSLVDLRLLSRLPDLRFNPPQTLPLSLAFSPHPNLVEDLLCSPLISLRLNLLVAQVCSPHLIHHTSRVEFPLCNHPASPLHILLSSLLVTRQCSPQVSPLVILQCNQRLIPLDSPR